MAKKKASLSMLKMQEQLLEPKAPPKNKPKKAAKKGAIAKTPVTAPAYKEERAASPAPEAKEGQIPRGERGDFLKTTLTLPADMLGELRALGMRRKAAKQKDTDTSALVREALADF